MRLYGLCFLQLDGGLKVRSSYSFGSKSQVGTSRGLQEGVRGNGCLIGSWQPPPHLARPSLLLGLGADLEALLGARGYDREHGTP